MLASLGSHISDDMARKYMSDLDFNGDGTIDYDEFKTFFMSGFKTESGLTVNKDYMGAM